MNVTAMYWHRNFRNLKEKILLSPSENGEYIFEINSAIFKYDVGEIMKLGRKTRDVLYFKICIKFYVVLIMNYNNTTDIIKFFYNA